MNDSIDELQKLWQEDKRQRPEAAQKSTSELIAQARRRQLGTIRFQYGNVLALLLVLAGIFYFLSVYLGMREPLSLVGLSLMYGGLVLRIVVEIYSIAYARRIDISQPSLVNTESTLAYHKFRRRVHGPLTLFVVGLYTAGFYMLIPEFAMYLATHWVLLIGASYPLIAIVPFWQIRKGIQKEIGQLEEIGRIRQMILDERPFKE
jgi:hypothetical protein